MLFKKSGRGHRANRVQLRTEYLESRELLTIDGPFTSFNSYKELTADTANEIAENPGPTNRAITPRIVNGTPTSDFPSVGNFSDFCSGTLVSPTHVLTAAHCTEGLWRGDGYFLVGEQSYDTVQIFDHPDYDPFAGTSDLSIVELDRPVEGIEPSQILRTAPEIGSELTLVGFGYGGSGAEGQTIPFGTKMVGHTTLEERTDLLLEWIFDNDLESNTASGDSGGPNFVRIDDVYYIAGITQGGEGPGFDFGSRSFSTRIDTFASFIDDVVTGAIVIADDHPDLPNSDATDLDFGGGSQAAVQANLETAHDQDAFEFSVAETSNVRLDLNSADFDTFLEVYNAAGDLIAESDDSGDTLNSRLGLVLESGTYFAVAHSYFFTGEGNYKLDVTVSSIDPDPEPDVLGVDAVSISLDEQGVGNIPGMLQTFGDVDFFQFTTQSAGFASVSLFSFDQDLNAHLSLFDADGVFVGSGFGQINRPIPAGTYYMSVSDLESISLALYNLQIQIQDPPVLELVNGVGFVDSQLAGIGEQDAYRLELDAPADVAIDLRSEAFDAFLEVYNEQGEIVSSDDDSGDGLNSNIRRIIPAGTYYVVVRAYQNAGTGSYRLDVSASSPFDVVLNDDGYGAVQGGLDSVGERDAYQFTLDSAGDITIDVTSTEIDSVLELIDGTGEVIEFDDDGGEELNSRIHRFLGPGTYFLYIGAYQDGDTGSYQVEISVNSPVEIVLDDQGHGTAGGQLDPIGDRDAYQFSVESFSEVTIDVTSPDFDTILDLIDASGRPIAFDDDGGEGLNSRIHRLLGPGTYFLYIGAFQEGGTGSYQLEVNAVASPSINLDENGIGSATDNLDFLGDLDAYRFDLTSSTLVTVGMASLEFDTFLELYDSDGNFLASDDDGGEDLNSRLSLFLEAGTYYVVPRAYADSGVGAYVVTVNLDEAPQFPDPSAPVIAINDDGDGGVSAALQFHGDRDAFSFTISEPSDVQFDLSSPEFDTYLYLYDGNGNFIASNDDAVEGLNSRLTRPLTPGIYYVQAAAYQDFGVGSYQISIQSTLPTTLNFDELGIALAEGILEDAEQGDWYSFAIPEDMVATLQLTVEGGNIPSHFELHGASGIISTGSSYGQSLIEVLFLSTGQYWLRASALNSDGSENYSLLVETQLPGDLNRDGFVSLNDFSILKNNFNRQGTPFAGDLDGDGMVALPDFSILKSSFGRQIRDVFSTHPEVDTASLAVAGSADEQIFEAPTSPSQVMPHAALVDEVLNFWS